MPRPDGRVRPAAVGQRVRGHDIETWAKPALHCTVSSYLFIIFTNFRAPPPPHHNTTRHTSKDTPQRTGHGATPALEHVVGHRIYKCCPPAHCDTRLDVGGVSPTASSWAVSSVATFLASSELGSPLWRHIASRQRMP